MVSLSMQKRERLSESWSKNFPGKSIIDAAEISAPGRMEILGNHTDHQHGFALTAAVNLDTAGFAAPNGGRRINVHSEGFPASSVDLGSLSPSSADFGTSGALLRGIADGFARNGLRIGGFDACVTTDVLKGSGLSSSAAFEVWAATAMNTLYNGGAVSPVQIAKICQYAENVHFGKPSGLQDQLASSVGGLLFIDFADTDAPIIEKMDFRMDGYAICIVDSHADHADLTPEYAAIPYELGKICGHFGKRWLREVDKSEFLAKVPELRKTCGDRALLRAFHIFCENERVLRAKEALLAGDAAMFFSLLRKSGESSFMYLQNVSAQGDPASQSLAVALALASGLLGEHGAFRIQGGGFAGTIEAFVPEAELDGFISGMDGALGAGSCHALSIRNEGASVICAQSYSDV